MTPNQKAKTSGLSGLSEITDAIAESDQKKRSVQRTLENWFKNKPKLFDACLLYAKSKKDK